MSSKLFKVFKWEFWPFWFFYVPVYVKYLWYSLRAGSMTFFSAANPAMYLGGFSMYSKHSILLGIEEKYLPKMCFLTHEDCVSAELVKEKLTSAKIDYPFVLKPDKGERGFGVEKISEKSELIQYLSTVKGNIIAQEYISYPLELGIMYHRFPDEKSGKVTSVVQKKFLSVTGDGRHSLLELINKGERTRYYTKMLQEKYAKELQNVLPKGYYKELISIGNHVRGTMFLNANHLINNQLQVVMDAIAVPIKGFYFGRFDLRVTSIEELYQGKNIKIMELNGANSEPAHIYDPSMKLFKAYGFLFRHWKNLFLISRENHRRGEPYPPVWKVYREMRTYFKTR